MPAYKLRVNGNDVTVDSWDPNQPLLYNAIFDATGVRLRTVPFTPERVKAALSKPQQAGPRESAAV